MPVTFQVSNHPARPVKHNESGPLQSVEGPEALLEATLNRKPIKIGSRQLFQSSFTKAEVDWESVVSCNNGFVDSVCAAYNKHHHLVIRPDDVWIAIMSQFNFYVNAHSEELRQHFVAHDSGQSELVVSKIGSRTTADFGQFARLMANEIQKNVVDKELKDWILPDFTTSTHHDVVTCAVLMMSTLKTYFSFCFDLSDCGIPSVTLEGKKSDWENILARLDKLLSFGSEPTQWADMLRPIIRKFISAFDGNPDVQFWERVYHNGGSSGSPTISGWITAFCSWDSSGNWTGGSEEEGRYGFQIDEVVYPLINLTEIPFGFGEVDVKLQDNGETFDCMMIAGHVSATIIGNDQDGLRPLPAWFLFEKEPSEDEPNVSRDSPTSPRRSGHSGGTQSRSRLRPFDGILPKIRSIFKK